MRRHDISLLLVALALCAGNSACSKVAANEPEELLATYRKISVEKDVEFALDLYMSGRYVYTINPPEGFGPMKTGRISEGERSRLVELFTDQNLLQSYDEDSLGGRTTVESTVVYNLNGQPVRYTYGDRIPLSAGTRTMLDFLDRMLIRKSLEGAYLDGPSAELGAKKCWAQP